MATVVMTGASGSRPQRADFLPKSAVDGYRGRASSSKRGVMTGGVNSRGATGGRLAAELPRQEFRRVPPGADEAGESAEERRREPQRGFGAVAEAEGSGPERDREA